MLLIKEMMLKNIDIRFIKNIRIKVQYPDIHIGTAEAYAGITPKKAEVKLTELIKKPISDWQKSY